MAMLATLAVLAPAPAPGAAEAEADVLARPILRGKLFAQEDFVRKSVSAAMARFALRAQDVAGKEARRALPAGATVRAADVGAPTLVRRGEAVSLVMRSGRLTIAALGRALGDGAAGGLVRVVNLATDRTLDAHVIAAGTAEVRAP